MYGGDRGYSGGPNFFDFLFGGAQAQQPASGSRGRNFIGPPRGPGRVSQR